jgi:hypothetical protein
MSMIPGYAITVQPPGMPATTVRLALGDLPQPFVVGDRLEILTSRPLFQWWLTQDVRKNGVTVVYTSYALDTALPAPLTLERGDGVCSSATDCAYETVQNVHAVAGGMSGDIPPNGHADVGDFRVFNIYAANGGPLGGSSCPTDVELNLFRIAVVRRTSIESDDGGTSVDGGTGR